MLKSCSVCKKAKKLEHYKTRCDGKSNKICKECCIKNYEGVKLTKLRYQNKYNERNKAYINKEALKRYHNYQFKKRAITKIHTYYFKDKHKYKFNDDKYINVEWIENKLYEQDYKCLYCKCELLLEKYRRHDSKQFSIDRINNNEAHLTFNCNVVCEGCNNKKRCRGVEEFLKEMKEQNQEL